MKYTKHRIIANADNLSRAIDNAVIGHKALRNREIMKMHYIDGLTFEEIAEELDLSDRHVKKICYDNEYAVISVLGAE